MDTILKTKNLCKYYGSGENEVKALQDVNIEIERGEFVAVVGKSGSGKVRCCTCWEAWTIPQNGKVYIGKKNIFSYKEDELAVFRRRKIGFIFQSFNLISSLNVWENIIFRFP